MSFLVRREPITVAPFNRLFENFFGPEGLATLSSGYPAAFEEGTLAIDVSEDEKNVLVRASLPGFSKEDVNVEVHEGVLSIKAEHAEDKEERGETFYRRERRVGSLSRRVALPSDVLEDQIGAELKDGVLTLKMPKNPKPSPKKVKIQ
jgi:HSP20 family protein